MSVQYVDGNPKVSCKKGQPVCLVVNPYSSPILRFPESSYPSLGPAAFFMLLVEPGFPYFNVEGELVSLEWKQKRNSL